MRFHDREDAGRRLAEALEHLRGEHPVVLGLPRGGVPVAYRVARALGAPLDVLVVRKLGVPGQEELAFGAVGEGGVRVLNDEVMARAGVRPEDAAATERAQRAEVDQRARRFREGRRASSVEGRTAILVDDGVATGSTAGAACRVAREQGASRVVLAVPTAPEDALAQLRHQADEVVCLSTPSPFWAVGERYRNFAQIPDDEVVALLARAAAADADEGPEGPEGDLVVPEGAEAVVMFAHGSGSSRHSPRNREVAAVLQRAGLGTLLFDLLTPGEADSRAYVFDTGTLARRLEDTARRLHARVPLPLGCFGASTGAAAALLAAADLDGGRGDGPRIDAVVSRGGRPDLAGSALTAVHAPTLLVVGGDDTTVLDLNRAAQAELRCENRLEVVPGASHLFEEPGALDRVAALARDWFLAHLTGQQGLSAPTPRS